jgi:hypothetical protein
MTDSFDDAVRRQEVAADSRAAAAADLAQLDREKREIIAEFLKRAAELGDGRNSWLVPAGVDDYISEITATGDLLSTQSYKLSPSIPYPSPFDASAVLQWNEEIRFPRYAKDRAGLEYVESGRLQEVLAATLIEATREAHEMQARARETGERIARVTERVRAAFVGRREFCGNPMCLTQSRDQHDLGARRPTASPKLPPVWLVCPVCRAARPNAMSEVDVESDGVPGEPYSRPPMLIGRTVALTVVALQVHSKADPLYTSLEKAVVREIALAASGGAAALAAALAPQLVRDLPPVRVREEATRKSFQAAFLGNSACTYFFLADDGSVWTKWSSGKSSDFRNGRPCGSNLKGVRPLPSAQLESQAPEMLAYAYCMEAPFWRDGHHASRVMARDPMGARSPL